VRGYNGRLLTPVAIARNDQHLLALIGEDGVRDVTIAPRNDAAAVAIGSKSWPFDIRLRPWVFRTRIGLLSLRYIAGGEVRPVATNGLESGRFRGDFFGLVGDASVI
jgi:hypothetical protein